MPMFDDTRADWLARKPRTRVVVGIGYRTEFMVHHDGGNPVGLFGKPHPECLVHVRSIQGFHMGPSRGWADIGYGALCCPHGRLIEGRGRDVIGAHCPGHNTAAISVQFMLGGNERPTQAMLERVRRYYDECCKASGRSLRKMGHRDGYSTDCPGDVLEAWVKAGMPSSSSPGTAGHTGRPVLRVGSTGSVVRTLQTALNKAGAKLDVDGDFGVKTQKAVRAFQGSKGLDVDGIVGKNTWAALLGGDK